MACLACRNRLSFVRCIEILFLSYLVFICLIYYIGSNYGSTSPQSINPETGVEYGIDFPDVTVRDTAKLIIKMLTNELNVRSVKSVIGGSFGGMQTLEIAYQALLENGMFVINTL